MKHEKEFNTVQATIEHIRRFHGQCGMRSPGGLGEYDSQKRIWYCFECRVPKNYKGRRCYDSDRAMWDHLVDFHPGTVSMIQTEVDLELSRTFNSITIVLRFVGNASTAKGRLMRPVR